MVKKILPVFFFFAVCGCTNTVSNERTSELKLTISNGFNQKVYLENMPAAGTKPRLLDSADFKDRVETRSFLIRDNEENLYRIYTPDHRLDIVFVNDAPVVEINADYFEPSEKSFAKSPATSSLHSFLEMNKRRMQPFRDIVPSANDSLLQKEIAKAQQDYRNYVDTVASPAAALFFYNAVDFHTDREQLKQYIDRLGKRFAHHSGIQKLCTDTRNYLSIFSEELEPGQAIPSLSLPDRNGIATSLSSFKGRYLLIDFWASWDQKSREELTFKLKAFEQFRDKKLSMVSVSLDPEKASWEQFVDQHHFPWVQLIDEKSWLGPAAANFKFDSIPFNFLVDPEGKIIARALYGDSLLVKLSAMMR